MKLMLTIEADKGIKKIHFFPSFNFGVVFSTFIQLSSLYRYVENPKGEEDLRAGYFCNYL
jgi:hypothetical protein